MNADVGSLYVEYLELLAAMWSSSVAATRINSELLAYLQPRFYKHSTPMKIRVVLSFLYLPKEVRVPNREILLQILSEAEVDKDEWVRKLSRLVSSYILVGAIDVRETDSETAYFILRYLNEQRKKHNLTYLNKPPLEAPHLANVLTESYLLNNSPPDQWRRDVIDWSTNDDAIFDNFFEQSRCQVISGDFRPRINFELFQRDLLKPGELQMIKARQKENTRNKNPH